MRSPERSGSKQPVTAASNPLNRPCAAAYCREPLAQERGDGVRKDGCQCSGQGHVKREVRGAQPGDGQGIAVIAARGLAAWSHASRIHAARDIWRRVAPVRVEQIH